MAGQTKLGTPCSPRWNSEWIRIVNRAEAKTRKRICGARTMNGTPCPLPPNHDNGRCKFHGGFDLTGARPGNRNAVIHGLYSRALKPCNPECKLWDVCPCSGEEVAKVKGRERPTCPYEATQYETVLSDALARVDGNPNADALDRHIAHQVATLSVMLNRAATYVREQPLIDTETTTGANHSSERRKPSAALQAFLRISSEYRRYIALLTPKKRGDVSDEKVRQQRLRAQRDISLLPIDTGNIEPETYPGLERGKDYLDEALSYHGQRLYQDARRCLQGARIVAPDLVRKCTDPNLAEYYNRAFVDIEGLAAEQDADTTDTGKQRICPP